MRLVSYALLLALTAAALPAQRSSVAGRAVDPAGAPVAGARVAERRGDGQAMSGVAGDFTLDVAAPHDAWLELSARGRATVRVPVLGRGQVGDVRLLPGAPAVGRVVDVSGRPVSGVLVVAEDQIAARHVFPAGESPKSEHRAHGRTDADGRFRIDGALESAVRIVVRPGPGREVIVGPVEPGRPVDVVVDVLREVRGHVLGPGGRGVERAAVYVERAGRRIVGGESAADGSFRLPVPEGEDLSVTASVLRGPRRTVSARVGLPASGAQSGVALTMRGDELLTLALCAVDSSGRPIERFQVGHLLGDPRSMGFRQAEVLGALLRHPLDARSGVVQVPFVARGTPFVAEVRSAGLGRVRVAASASPASVVVTLGPESVIRGRVVDAETGRPVRWAKVAVARAEESFVAASEADFSTARPAMPPLEMRSGPDGSFEIRELSAGRWIVLVAVDGLFPCAEREVTLRAGEVLDGVLVRLDAGGRLDGRVGSAGDVTGARVRFRSASGILSPAVGLAADGTFGLVGLPRESGYLDLLVPQPPRLGGPLVLELGPAAADGDLVEVQVDQVLRPVRGQLRVEGSPPPRGRLCVVLESGAPTGRADRSDPTFAGARAWVGSDGSFALFAEVGDATLWVVDAATGVVFERKDVGSVRAGADVFELPPLEVCCVRARIGLTAGLLDRARRIDVDLGPLSPPGVPPVAEAARPWDRALGVDVARGQGEVVLFLPASESRLAVRGEQGGEALATALVDPGERASVEVELLSEDEPLDRR